MLDKKPFLRIWSLEDWEEIKALKHPAAVRDFSADPSGKLLLTIGNDKTLRAWDLAKGREAFTKSFRDQPERVLWGPDGRRYALQLTAGICQIQTLEESKEKVQIESKDRIMDIKFFRFFNLLFKVLTLNGISTKENLVLRVKI